LWLSFGFIAHGIFKQIKKVILLLANEEIVVKDVDFGGINY